MPHLRSDHALAHCTRIRELVLHRSWADPDALTEFRTLTASAARFADDPECAGMMRAADRYALDLFSRLAHENWATPQASGRDFLRQQILRLLEAFQDRMMHLDAVGQG